MYPLLGRPSLITKVLIFRYFQGGPGLDLGKKDLVPGSDGAGVVEAVGSKVTIFRVGDRVCTHLTSGLAEDELPRFEDIGAGLGQTVDGTLRQYGIFHETALVKMPSHLTLLEAATLPCSGLTAWNALFGLESRAPRTGATVLVQGTGGVSIAALQVRSTYSTSLILFNRMRQLMRSVRCKIAHPAADPTDNVYPSSLSLPARP